MHRLTIQQQIDGLRAGNFSSRELTQHYLDRIAQQDPAINSYITVTGEQALQQADAADKARAQGDTRPLLGLPIAYKDIFCTRGVKTSCGSKMLDNFIAPYDAHAVDLCQQAGLISLGKTNLDEFAMGSTNESSYYGAVHNPWDLKAVPGGSSGGSAAAVSARLTPWALGTDTGGSVRQPASWCGITGLKPTYGRISRYGMIAYASSLDQCGLLAHSAADIATLLPVVSGFDPKDSTSIDKPVENYSQHLNNDIKGLRIGIPKRFLEGEGLNPEIKQLCEQTLQLLEGLGANVIDIELPHADHAIVAYYVIALAECSSNLSRYDGVRYGYRCDQPKDLLDLYERSRSEAFGEEVKRRIMLGAYALSAGYYDAYYLKAQQLRRLISNDYLQAFEKVDVIMGPTTPTPAYTIGEAIKDPVSMYLGDIYTVPVNLAGLPALSLPTGMVGERPIGVQLIGPHFAEHRLLNIAHQYQQHSDWHQRMPTTIA